MSEASARFSRCLTTTASSSANPRRRSRRLGAWDSERDEDEGSMVGAEPNRVPPLPESKTPIFLMQPSLLTEAMCRNYPWQFLPCAFSVRTHYPRPLERRPGRSAPVVAINPNLAAGPEDADRVLRVVPAAQVDRSGRRLTERVE